MNIPAAIMVDLEQTPLGTRSRLAHALAGKPLLRHTLERTLHAKSIKTIHVLVPARQASALQPLIAGLPVRLETHDAPPPAYAALVRAARVWALDGWRGGIGGMCCFDEDLHLPALAALAQREQLEAVVAIPAAAAVIDPGLIDAMVAHYRKHHAVARITFTQAPPGLAPLVIGRAVIDELAPTGQTVGALLAYHPSSPVADLTGREPCYRPDAAIIEARGRLIADTRRSWDRVAALLADSGVGRSGPSGAAGNAKGDLDWDAARIAAWLHDRDKTHVDTVPEEIEIELTTHAPLSQNGLLRPTREEVGDRGPLSTAVLDRIIETIRDHDDVRLVLAGFGDPCGHPAFPEICAKLRRSTALALAVRTTSRLDDPAIETALFETPVDVVEVALDAATADTYAAVHAVAAPSAVDSAPDFAAVTARLERWLARRLSQTQVRPLIVPSMIKANETLGEMETFYDGWLKRLGMALLTGHSHYAGQRPDRRVTSTTPPHRTPCRRVFSRLLILADGRVTTCDQDYRGLQSIGTLNDSTLSDLWQNPRLTAIRTAQHDGLPLCPHCTEWHRP